jgi:hypothetical protein
MLERFAPDDIPEIDKGLSLRILFVFFDLQKLVINIETNSKLNNFSYNWKPAYKVTTTETFAIAYSNR